MTNSKMMEISKSKRMKKLSPKEAAMMKAELEKRSPGKTFVFNPNVIQLPPLNMEVSSILDAAIKRLGDVVDKNPKIDDATFSKTTIVFPVREPQNTKKNKMRLVENDTLSPLGLINKNDAFAAMRYRPYASAHFIARDVVAWASKKIAIAEAEAEKAKIESEPVVVCDEPVQNSVQSEA